MFINSIIREIIKYIGYTYNDKLTYESFVIGYKTYHIFSINKVNKKYVYYNKLLSYLLTSSITVYVFPSYDMMVNYIDYLIDDTDSNIFVAIM